MKKLDILRWYRIYREIRKVFIQMNDRLMVYTNYEGIDYATIIIPVPSIVERKQMDKLFDICDKHKLKIEIVNENFRIKSKEVKK